MTGCARRESPPPAPTPVPQVTKAPRAELPQRRPLQIRPAKPRVHFRAPEFHWETPQWRPPEYHFEPGLLPQANPQLDGRFDHWHLPELSREQPRLLKGREFDFDQMVQQPKADVFRTMKWNIGGDNSVQGALDDFERQQKALREKYVPFPIPVTLPIPF